VNDGIITGEFSVRGSGTGKSHGRGEDQKQRCKHKRTIAENSRRFIGPSSASGSQKLTEAATIVGSSQKEFLKGRTTQPGKISKEVGLHMGERRNTCSANLEETR